MLRPDLLTGRRFATAGVPDEVAAGLSELHADLFRLPDPAAGEPGQDEAELSAWCAAHGPLDGIIAAAPAGAGDPTDADRITSRLADVWRAVRAVAVDALHPGGPGGRIVLIGPPRPRAAAHDPVTAGLENLARTLSVEWARFGVSAVCLDPGPATDPRQIAALTAFAVSAGGGYLSGCCLRLGSVPVAERSAGAG